MMAAAVLGLMLQVDPASLDTITTLPTIHLH